MKNFADGLAFHAAGASVDFSSLLEGVRALKPKCVECGIPLQESLTGVRVRKSEDGHTEKLCRACAVSEIGERLIADLPK